MYINHNPQNAKVRFNRGAIVYSEQPNSTALTWIIRLAFVAIVIILVLGFVGIAKADNTVHANSKSRCWLYTGTTRYSDSDKFVKDAPQCYTEQTDETIVKPERDTIVHGVNNDPSPVQDATTQNDDSTPEKVTKEHTDHGNHYGNDRPDNNSNDTKNKHDGCDSNCTGKNK